MQRQPALRETQRIFWELVIAPAGVRDGLAALGLRESDLEELIASDEQLSALGRLDVYANMYFFRLLDALKEDYPQTVTLLGEETFHNLITDYVLAHPSANPSLRHLGATLPAFVGAHPLAKDRPYLADLVNLEWARADIFDAADTTSVTRADLAAVSVDQWAALKLRFVPAMRIIECAYAADELWDELRRDVQPQSTQPTPTKIRVWRKDDLVYHDEASDQEVRALGLFGSGADLQGVCAEMMDDDTENVALAITGLLQRWIDQGIIAAVEF